MESEKSNNAFKWTNKLDDLDHLPGESSTDKMAGWNKLQNRLQNKPHTRTVVLRWSAAASVLLVITISLFMLNRKDKGFAKADKQQPLKITPVVITPTTKKEETANLSELTETGKKTAAVFKIENSRINHNHIKLQPAKNLVTIHPDTIVKTHTEIMTAALKLVDTVAIATALPAKKKLRIVHINELDKTVNEETRRADNSTPSFFVMQLFKRNEYSGPVANGNVPDHTIKIKLSSSN